MTVTQISGSDRSGRTMVVAQRVRGLMGELRYSQAKLAHELHMTQQAFSRRTSGAVEFRVGEIEQLAGILAVSEAYLYGFTNDRTPDQELAGGNVVRHVGLEPTTR